MDKNEQAIINFFEAFSKRDFDAMNEIYSDDIIYFDPKVDLLREGMAKKLWKILFNDVRDFFFSYGSVQTLDEEYYTCENLILYRHPETNRKIKDKRKSYFRMADGKILEHSEGFKLYGWNRQAFGVSGWILGWNSAFQKRVRNRILSRL